MKKLFLLIASGLVAVSAMAEGYQINTLSARQLGMGHTGVALKLGAESMIFNPAGLAFSDKTLDVTGSVTGIIATAKATIDGSEYETNNKISTPMAFNAAFRVYDNLQIGISFFTPYGSAINWGENWPGAVLNQKVNLKTFTLQPTVAWRVLPNFSVGAGLNVAWGSVDLYKGLLNPADFGGLVPASININGGTKLAVGVNLGVMWDINDKWTVGADFRSKMMMKVDGGDARVNYGNVPEALLPTIEAAFSNIDNVNFNAEMPLPYVLQFGVSYKPIDKLTLAFDAQLTGWKTYKKLDINFDLPPALQAMYNQSITKDYKNAWCFHVGGEYALTDRFDVRAGLMVDTTPVNKKYYNPETPGMTKIEPTVGLSFRPIPAFSIDFGLMYIAGLGADDTECTYENFMHKVNPAVPETVTVKADYKLNAWAPSIGMSYSF